MLGTSQTYLLRLVAQGQLERRADGRFDASAMRKVLLLTHEPKDPDQG
jgi:hypothetical protein